MADPITAADLTAQHHGWSIEIPIAGWAGRRTIKLGGIRRWHHDGQDYVGVLDTDDASGTVRGTEHHLLAAAQCTPIRKLAASRPRRGAYPAAS